MRISFISNLHVVLSVTSVLGFHFTLFHYCRRMKFTREAICEILAHCDSQDLTSLVDTLLESGSIKDVRAVRSPEVGTVQLQVREPICEERFILGDALVTVAEVAVGSSLGWAMRTGNDPHGAVAAAILDGWVAQSTLETDALHLNMFEDLLEATVLQKSAERSMKTSQVLSTAIQFEELD